MSFDLTVKEILGIKPVLARDLAHKLYYYYSGLAYDSLSALLADLNIDNSGNKFISLLLEEGFITATPEGQPLQKQWFNLTPQGVSLALSKHGKRFDKKVRDEIIQGIIDRASALNADSSWLDWIDCIYLYGSCLNDSATSYGDVDIAIVTERKVPFEEYRTLTVKGIKNGLWSGKGDFMSQLYVPLTTLKRALRARKSKIHMCDFDSRNKLDTEYRLIYCRGGSQAAV